MEKNIVIVGAGLSGLRAASLLTAQGIKCTVLEARDRIGGRILSSSISSNPELGKYDLGPSWFWPQHEKSITKLVRELNLKTFVQYTKGAMLFEHSPNEAPERYAVPENAAAMSMRFTGGVQSLIDALAETIPPEVVELNTRVTAIQLENSDTITIEAAQTNGKGKKLSADAVILALPPRIVANHINFSPLLPLKLMNELVNKPTWMAGQAKAVVIYDRPFWRESGLSGFVSSRIGPLQEIHDASLDTGNSALFGFVGIPAKIRQELGKDEMIKLIKDQLVRLFGPSAKNIKSVLYKDWSEDIETAVEEDLIPLREYPRYGPLPNTGVWENKIMFAGTETSSLSGGHLEGALQAAERAVTEILKLSDKPS